jgi:hypothetical protein
LQILDSIVQQVVRCGSKRRAWSAIRRRPEGHPEATADRNQEGAGMKRRPQDATREAAGCFVMLILGAIVTLGGLAILLPGLVATLAGKTPAGLWRSVLIWVVAPAVGIAIVGWLTYAYPRRKSGGRRR